MKLHIEESAEYGEVDITVKCPAVDDELKSLIEKIRLYGFAIHATKDGQTCLIKPTDIYYTESVDDKTFIYCKSEVFGSDKRLYVLEEQLPSGYFVRVSKSCIINIKKIRGFRSQFNGKLEATMINGEKIEVNRHYVPDLKKRLTEMEEAK